MVFVAGKILKSIILFQITMYRSITQRIGIIGLVLFGTFLAVPSAQATKPFTCQSNSLAHCEMYAVTPAGAKDQATIKLYDQSGLLINTITPYGLYHGTVVVRRGDVDGDGEMEFISAPGNSGTALTVKIWSVNLRTSSAILEKTLSIGAYDLGATLTLADVNGDKTPEIVVAAHTTSNDIVFVYSYDSTKKDYVLLDSFTAYVANVDLQSGDVNNDGADELVTAPSSSTGEIQVYQWDGSKMSLQASFFPFSKNQASGLRVRVGNVVGDAKQELVVTPRFGTLPEVKVFGWNGTRYSLLTSFNAYGDVVDALKIRTGVALRLGDVAGDTHLEIVTAPWQENTLPIRVWYAHVNGKFYVLARQFIFPAAVQGLNLLTRDVTPDRHGNNHEEILVAPRGRGSPLVYVLRFNPLATGRMEVVWHNMPFHPRYRAEIQFDADAS